MWPSHKKKQTTEKNVEIEESGSHHGWVKGFST
jgi:hypothetical protein